MNVGRGLFRAWVLVSILWIAGAGTAAYLAVVPDTVSGNYQPVLEIRKEAWNATTESIDWNKPFYELIVSPSAEKSEVLFSKVDWEYLAEWEKGQSHKLVNFPDDSTLFVQKQYTEADKEYVVQQFWQQRWTRRGKAAGIVAAWALVPCVALFALGYALLWVGRGFRRA